MTEHKNPGDEFMEQAATISMEWFDITPVAQALADQFKRGFDAGVASVEIDKEALQREYERGQNDYRDQLLAKIGGLKMPIVSSIEETTGPGRGPKPKDPERPVGIPSNFEMCRMVLIDAGKPLTATEIRECVKVRWWPEVPTDWKSSPFGFLGSGKLIKDADGKFVLPDVTKKPERPAKLPPQEIINQEVAKRQAVDPPPIVVVKPTLLPEPRVLPEKPIDVPMPAVRPTEGPRHVVTPGAKLGPPAKPGNAFQFEWRGNYILLHEKEHKMLQRLKPTIGKGFLDFSAIANAAFSPRNCPGDSRAWLRDMVPIINPKIQRLGLELKLIEKMGYALAELT